jgi:hypothetical protein
MPATGARGTQRVSPRNITGQIYKEQQAEQAAREAAEAEIVDLAAVKRAEFLRGWEAGFDAGVEAILKQLRDLGLDLDADEPEETAV